MFCRGYVGDNSWYACATNCVFNEAYFGDSSRYSRVFATNCWNCVVTNLDAIGVLDDGRLAAGSPAIDLGGQDIAGAAVDLDGVDAFGTQRIYNGRLDAGAAEFDWRTRYARALGRTATVSVASPAVRKEGSDIAIWDGELAGSVTAGGTCVATVLVTGNGTLNLEMGGEAVRSFTAADGRFSLSLPGTLAGTSWRFLYEPGEEDAGCALVSRLSIEQGLTVIVR